MKKMCIILALTLSGCSSFIQPPPNNWEHKLSQRPPSRCTNSKLLPTVDLIWAGVGIVGGTALIVHHEQSDYPSTILRGIGAVSISEGVVRATVGANGMTQVSQCQKYLRRVREQ